MPPGEMVKFRGIEITIISQFDMRKLPEIYLRDYNDPFEFDVPSIKPIDSSIASCYVQIYSGAQVCFEYAIDAPHPPNAAYFFKMLHEGKPVTSWDCTAKHDYNGRTTYNLQHIGVDSVTDSTVLRRQAFRFSAKDSRHITKLQDYIEIRVHRIEHRQRIAMDTPISVENQFSGNVDARGFCLVDSGPVGAETPRRLYRYQLLDPKDKPYATFRFFYRSYGWLKQQTITDLESATRSSESSMSVGSRETSRTARGSANHYEPSSFSWNSCQYLLEKRIDSNEGYLPPTSTAQTPFDSPKAKGAMSEPKENECIKFEVPSGDSNESLRVVTKDSIEDLQSSVPRSPKPSRQHGQLPPGRSVAAEIPDSPRLPPYSPTKSRKKALTLNTGGVDFNDDESERPLSPSTNRGMLRKTFTPSSTLGTSRGHRVWAFHQRGSRS